ncbi:MAG: DUF6273 domain-containing protein [Coriobacteriia bacterium]|nr:DUF6273 domain-containing protein [Coriobacteriia bacterium]
MREKIQKRLGWRKKLTTALVLMMAVTTILPLAMTAEAAVLNTPTVGVYGRVLPASQAGDSSDWVEIARNDGYSLILRKDVLPVGWQAYTTSGTNNVYSISNVRNIVNNWFNNTLSSSARLKNYTTTHNALTEIGYFASFGGISKPTGISCKSGNDVAFLLSFGEAASFCSLQYATSSSSWKASSDLARTNFNKLTPLPSNAQQDFWWLRSPGFTSYSACSVGTHTAAMGNIVWCSSSTNFKGYDYVRPALWVNSGIFGPDVVIPQKANIVVNHVDANTGALIESERFTVDAGAYGPYPAKNIAGYKAGVWLQTSDPASGTITGGQTKTITYLYGKGSAVINVIHINLNTYTIISIESEYVPAGLYGPYPPLVIDGYNAGQLQVGSAPFVGTINDNEIKTIIWGYSRITN